MHGERSVRLGRRFIRLIFLAASSNAGVQFVNSIQYSLAAPLFQSQYHLASSFTALIIALAGPLRCVGRGARRRAGRLRRDGWGACRGLFVF